ncbi:hypothetical protein JDV02_002587 [Purpureocillium takamizusanense]|uniref:Phytocyanin domain-containing protein n=1 Tax=Purpureocillium takamizusanense TaxID=2060973 RepID=A0A9Q8Q8Z7_9HYPO|nr:uncharacterized protein JDV02_002587 [Purpureocillium takamizusanense]UNI16119.1 hypothetical protein JDV02_002587 [Purpureocillium takamizusanense]
MKFSTTLSLALAPVALARKVRDVFPPRSEVGAIDDKAGLDILDERGVTVIEGMRGAGITVNSRTDVVIIWANPGGGAATTTINQAVTVTKTVTAGGGGGRETNGAGARATHTVKVGGAGGLTFQPQELNNVPVGDMIEFEFGQQSHSVTQSSFAKPCVAMAGGMDSGFVPNPNGTVSPPPKVAMQVMTTDATWFYCKQQGHCGKGMAFSLNPTAEKTHAQFQAAAIAQNGTGQAAPIAGGNGSNGGRPSGTSPNAPGATGGNGGGNRGGNGGGNNNNAGNNNGSVTPGQGTLNPDGSCSCVVSCASGAFPAQNQGVGSFGGMGGALPLNMAAMRK